MRRPVRASPGAPRVGCPRGQVVRALWVTLLNVSLALPAQAAPSEAPVVAPPSEPPPEATSSQAEAIRLFRAAKELYSAGRYDEAAGGFAASFAAAESAEAAYNAALAHDKVGAPLATMTWFRRYLAVARSDTDPSYPQALKRVEELRARLGELRLQIDDPAEIREVRVNGQVIELTDFPQLVEPGRIEVRLIGDDPDEVADLPAEVSPGGTWTIHFSGFARAPEPARDPKPEPPTVRDPPDPEPSRRHRTLVRLFWTGAGLTAASAIGVAVFGGLVLRVRDDPQCGMSLCPDDAEDFKRYQRDANIMVGVASGLAVVTLALGLAAVRERRKSRAQVLGGRLRLTATGLQLAF